jgi:hypothetical protein
MSALRAVGVTILIGSGLLPLAQCSHEKPRTELPRVAPSQAGLPASSPSASSPAGIAGLSKLSPQGRLNVVWAEPDAEEPNEALRTAPQDEHNAACASCHAAIVKEWRQSYHRLSYSDSLYQQALVGEPTAYCNGCHASLGVARGAEGVGCERCHGQAPKDHGRAGLKAARTRYGGFAKDARSACKGCHDFPFPDSKESMQLTFQEHAVSTLPAKSCMDCHMQKREGHVRHDFVASHDLETLRAAIEPHIEWNEDGAVTLELRGRNMGHAFPTGDMFRRVIVRAFTEDASGKIVSDSEHQLRRWFTTRGGKLTQERDTRAFLGTSEAPASNSFRLPLGPLPEGGTLNVNLRYERPIRFLHGEARGDGVTLYQAKVRAE